MTCTLLGFGAIAAGIASLVVGMSFGWMLLGFGAIPIMIVEWYRGVCLIYHHVRVMRLMIV